MKPWLKIALSALASIAFILLLVILNAKSGEMRRKATCQKLKVTIIDSAYLGFVNKNDIKQIIDREYGIYTGQRLDSVNLRKIEKILEKKTSILKEERLIQPGTVFSIY